MEGHISYNRAVTTSIVMFVSALTCHTESMDVSRVWILWHSTVARIWASLADVQMLLINVLTALSGTETVQVTPLRRTLASSP